MASFLADSAEHFTSRVLIAQLAARHRLPAIYPAREFVEVGSVLAYGVDNANVWRRIPDMTDQLLRGEKPGDIPFDQQTKFELVLNQTTARSLGLDFLASPLAISDEVIDEQAVAAMHEAGIGPWATPIKSQSSASPTDADEPAD